MALCGETIEAGTTSLWSSLEKPTRPLAWLASFNTCGLIAKLECGDVKCPSFGYTKLYDVKDHALVVDIPCFVLQRMRDGSLSGLASNSTVCAAVHGSLGQLGTQFNAAHKCNGDQHAGQNCAGPVTTQLVSRSGHLPPIITAEYDSIVEEPAVKDFLATAVPDESISVTVGSLCGQYDLAGLVYCQDKKHFVAQFCYMGRVFYHDGLNNGGRAHVVGTKIDVAYGRKMSVNSTQCAALYVLQQTRGE